MKEIKVLIYEFEELTANAQKKVFADHRQDYVDPYWWTNVYEDFIDDMKKYGIVLAHDDIHFSGFGSQGDGASFDFSMCSDDIMKYLTFTNQLSKYKILVGLIRNNSDVAVYTLTNKFSNTYSHEHTRSTYTDHSYSGKNSKIERKLAYETELLCEDIETLRLAKCKYLYQSLNEEYTARTEDDYIKEWLINTDTMFYVNGDVVNDGVSEGVK